MTVERAGGAIAPRLEVIQDFLNTLDERRFSLRGLRHTGGDALATPDDLSAWLAGHALIPAGTRACPQDLATAWALRDALRSLLRLRAGHQTDDHASATAAGGPPAAALSHANAALGRFPLRVQGGAGGKPRLLPDGRGVPAALAAIAAAAALAEAAGTWKRLKVCAAPDCRWVFYDTSRGGAARWCSMRVCGNRGKTRAYRQRRRGGASPPRSR